MYNDRTKNRTPVLLVLALCVPFSAVARSQHAGQEADKKTAAGEKVQLWRDPVDISSRSLFYGAGGRDRQPQGKLTFVRELLSGTNPKFVARDDLGTIWGVKLGEEAQPETAASRLVWAAGYFADEEYYLPELHIEGMPCLSRGQQFVSPDGTVRGARLKRFTDPEKRRGTWRWKENPFVGTETLNGLRVMMQLINNWDLKTVNNEIEEHEGRDGPELWFIVSDLGASFGTTNRTASRSRSKGNLKSYEDSTFITNVTPEYVDFAVPSRPELVTLVSFREYVDRVREEWIGKRVPREDARWIGRLLGQLSAEQIADAFRAAGYSPVQVDGFTRVLTERIAVLNRL